ncbi:MAG: hypothetical protein V5786_02090 [Psychromonas sp.]
MKHYLSAFLVLFLLSACSHSNKASTDQSQMKYTFHSVGYAPIDIQSGGSFENKMLNAIKASKIEAYKEMAEQIHGVLLSSDNTLNGASLGHDKINAHVSGLVRGARVLKSYHEGDLYITELELNMETLSFLNKSGFNDEANSIIKVERSVYY